MSRKIAKHPSVSRKALAFGLLLAVMALVLGHATKAHAAPGDLDTTFSGDGKLTTSFGSGTGDAQDIAIQGDGKVVVVGGYRPAGSPTPDVALARYNPDGTLDPTFGGGDGRVTTAIGPGYDEARALVVRGGKILVAGTSYQGASTDLDFALLRYNLDGTLDQTFGSGGAVTIPIVSGEKVMDKAEALAVQADGKIVVAGWSGSDFALARFNPDGTLDTSSDADPSVHFDTDGKVTTDFDSSQDGAYALTLQPDGKIVAAGESLANDLAKRDFALARYNTDGSLDTTFGSGGRLTTDFGNHDTVEAVVVEDDGSIFAAGYSANQVASDFALARYDEGGTPVGSFGSFGKVTTNFVDDGNFGTDDVAFDLAIQSDGKLVAAGYTNGDFALARYALTGALDSTFSQDGKATTDFGSSERANALAIQTDGRIVAAGTSGLDFALARYYGGEDATPPTVSAPVQRLISGSALTTNNKVFVRLSWSGNDTGSGLAHYQLQQKNNTGAFTNVPLSPLTATTKTLSLSPNKTYQFRVRALDNNGNWSAWKTASRFTVDLRQENGVGVSYPSGTWKAQSVSSASGGAVKYATTKDATARFTFRGRNVAWVAPKSTTRGQAEVWLDGVKLATVDLRSATAQARKLVFVKNGLNPSVTHKLEVKVLGTPGRPRVDVDAFAVLR
jgi:uncharacterized delta-60 repeat protein